VIGFGGRHLLRGSHAFGARQPLQPMSVARCWRALPRPGGGEVAVDDRVVAIAGRAPFVELALADLLAEHKLHRVAEDGGDARVFTALEAR